MGSNAKRNAKQTLKLYITMNKIDNPLQDLIELNNRHKRIETKSALIDKVTDEVENRKKATFNRVSYLESKSIHIPTDIESFIAILLKMVEEREKLRNEWSDLCRKRGEMDKYTNGLEKIIVERGGYNLTTDEKQEIEVLIKHYDDISIKQENLLNRRIQIQEEEKNALSEIERILEGL